MYNEEEVIMTTREQFNDVKTAIELKDFHYALSIAYQIDNEKLIKALGDVIIEYGNAECILKFAAEVEKADIEKCEDKIIEINDPSWILLFACEVDVADIKKLETAIIETNSTYYIYRFAFEVNRSNVTRLEDAIINAFEKTPNKDDIISDIYIFAADVVGANIERLEKIAIAHGNEYWINEFEELKRYYDLHKDRVSEEEIDEFISSLG